MHVAYSYNPSELKNLAIASKPRDAFTGQSRSPNMSYRYVTYGFLLVCYSTFVRKTYRFWDIWLQTAVTLKTGLGSVKVVENATIRQRAYDFLLTFHSNHGPISYRFRDRWWFQSKIANFSNPVVFCVPAEGVPLGIGYKGWGSKN